MSTIIVPNRVTSSTSSSSSSQIKQEHIKDENNGNSITNNSSNNNDSFFKNWNVGNWCWERDYNKYPVISFPHHNVSNNNNSKCHDDKGITDRRSNDAKINTTDGPSDDNVQNGGDDDNVDIDDDEKKPAAIKSSAFDSSRFATTSSGCDATTSAIEKATATKKKDVWNISGCRIKKEKKEEGANKTNGFNNNNNNDDDDDDDDSFYDDWVEGNWCLLNNCDNNNNDNSNDDSPCKSIPTTRSRKKRTRNNNNTNKKSTPRRSKRKRDDEDSYNEGNNGDDGDEEHLLEGNDDVRNHQEKDKRSANKRAQNWIGMYQKLVEYKKEHKSTMVPAYYEEDPKLGCWVTTQRRNYKTDRLLPNRYALLNSVEFKWVVVTGSKKVDNKKWMNMFQKLVEYKNQHKNTMVPQQYEKDPKLGWWASTQRRYYTKGDLRPNRVDLLKSIDFEWNGAGKGMDTEKWMNMFQKLVEYKKQHKSTIVPQRYEKDPKLGIWVFTQRRNYQKKAILPNRIDLLNSIGFEWDGVKSATDQIKWMNMFQKLVEYKKQHKNTKVPKRCVKDPKLGSWIGTQRQAYRNDELLPKRLALLNSIDF